MYFKYIKKKYEVEEVKGDIFDKSKNSELQDQLRLFRVMKSENCIRLFIKIDNSKVYQNILESKYNKTRYKNYCLKMMIKRGMKTLIDREMISLDDGCKLIPETTFKRGYNE